MSNRLKEGIDLSVLVAGTAPSGIQCHILGSTFQEGHGKTAERPVKGYKVGDQPRAD